MCAACRDDVYITDDRRGVVLTVIAAGVGPFWAGLDRELVGSSRFATYVEAPAAVVEWISWYTRERRDASLSARAVTGRVRSDPSGPTDRGVTGSGSS